MRPQVYTSRLPARLAPSATGPVNADGIGGVEHDGPRPAAALPGDPHHPWLFATSARRATMQSSGSKMTAALVSRSTPAMSMSATGTENRDSLRGLPAFPLLRAHASEVERFSAHQESYNAISAQVGHAEL